MAAADLVDATDLDATEKDTSELGITDLGQTDDANQIAATEANNVAEIEDERLAATEQIENQVIAAPEDLASVITAVDLTPIDSTSESEVKAADNALHDQVNTEFASQEPAAQKTEVSATRPIVGKPSMPIDGPRTINDNGWLYAQAPDAYTLQLASFDNAQKIAEFESSAKFIKNPELHRFTAMRKDIEWTYFLYGSYSSIELAQAAKIDLNQKLAWIRSFGQLQKNSCAVWKTQSHTHKELSNNCGAR
jgi:septal ring-binding cell division protein DamX